MIYICLINVALLAKIGEIYRNFRSVIYSKKISECYHYQFAVTKITRGTFRNQLIHNLALTRLCCTYMGQGIQEWTK